MGWFWAAYQMGGWRDVMDGGMPQSMFGDRVLELMSSAPFDWVLEAKVEDGVRPVALILGFQVGRAIEPGVEWFPWASPRNKIEATAVFLKEISKVHKLMVFAPEWSDDFWARFCQHRMVRRGCKVLDYFSRGEHAMMFYTPGPY